MKILVMLLALAGISAAMTTREQRAEARHKMRWLTPWAWGVALAGLLFMLWPWPK